MAIRSAEAIILQRWDYRETSVILSVYTEHSGKVHGLIKGFRRQPPRYRSPALVGSLNSMVFYDSPRTQLVLIAQCDLVDSVSSVCPETARLMAQSQVLELIARGTAMRDPHPDMFHLILRALRDVREDRDPSIVARVFAMKFLQATGLSPAVDECVHCTRTPRRGTALSSRLGGLLCERCVSQDPSAHTVMPGTLATMQHVLRSHWTNALRVHYGSRIREELDSIMNRYLAFHVDTRLRSRHVPQELAHANASLS